jgi:V-type H+-transporting ATPase subunit F
MTHKLRYRQGEERLIAIIGDEDTITGFLLAGAGDSDSRSAKTKGANFIVVHKTTPLADIEAAFLRFSQRSDVGAILICQHIANDIRHLIQEHKTALPVVLEIPSKDAPYDSEKDDVLQKINRSLGCK